MRPSAGEITLHDYVEATWRPSLVSAWLSSGRLSTVRLMITTSKGGAVNATIFDAQWRLACRG